jgi:hypothetical protein
LDHESPAVSAGLFLCINALDYEAIAYWMRAKTNPSINPTQAHICFETQPSKTDALLCDDCCAQNKKNL